MGRHRAGTENSVIRENERRQIEKKSLTSGTSTRREEEGGGDKVEKNPPMST